MAAEPQHLVEGLHAVGHARHVQQQGNAMRIEILHLLRHKRPWFGIAQGEERRTMIVMEVKDAVTAQLHARGFRQGTNLRGRHQMAVLGHQIDADLHIHVGAKAVQLRRPLGGGILRFGFTGAAQFHGELLGQGNEAGNVGTGRRAAPVGQLQRHLEFAVLSGGINIAPSPRLQPFPMHGLGERLGARHQIIHHGSGRRLADANDAYQIDRRIDAAVTFGCFRLRNRSGSKAMRRMTIRRRLRRRRSAGSSGRLAIRLPVNGDRGGRIERGLDALEAGFLRRLGRAFSHGLDRTLLHRLIGLAGRFVEQHILPAAAEHLLRLLAVLALLPAIKEQHDHDAQCTQQQKTQLKFAHDFSFLAAIP